MPGPCAWPLRNNGTDLGEFTVFLCVLNRVISDFFLFVFFRHLHAFLSSVFVVVVPVVTDRFAETECEDDAEDLDGHQAHAHADHHVQVTDGKVVDRVVAAL